MLMDIHQLDGEQYCMHCRYWGKQDGRPQCLHGKAKKCWFANQLNGCDYFDGQLQPKRDWDKAWKVGYRPGTIHR